MVGLLRSLLDLQLVRRRRRLVTVPRKVPEALVNALIRNARRLPKQL